MMLQTVDEFEKLEKRVSTLELQMTKKLVPQIRRLYKDKISINLD